MDDLFLLHVTGLVINHKNQLLVLKTRIEEGWDVPGSNTKRGEDMTSSLKKELIEEIGIKVDHIHPVGITLADTRVHREKTDVGLILALYLVEVDKNTEISLGESYTDYEWVTPAKAAELLENKYPEEVTEAIKSLV